MNKQVSDVIINNQDLILYSEAENKVLHYDMENNSLVREYNEVIMPDIELFNNKLIIDDSDKEEIDIYDIETGKHIILDVKGSDFNIDPVFKIKWKLLKQQLQDNKNIQFKLIIKYKDVWYDLENKEEKKKYKEVYSKRKKKTK